MNQIYFTADLHFGHPNIIKHSIKRPFSDPKDIAWHDEWLLQLWKCTVDKHDTVYILGDLTFLKKLCKASHKFFYDKHIIMQSKVAWLGANRLVA